MRALRSCSVATLIFICVFTAFSFAGCSQRDRQRAKDDADRRAIVGDWDDGTPGVRRFFPDGTYWQSNTVSPNNFRGIIRNPPSYKSRVLEGKWSITNGDLVVTYRISWDGNMDTQKVHVVHHRIIRLTGHEMLTAAFNVHGGETNLYPIGIVRRAR